MTEAGRAYWDRIARRYQNETHISCADVHYGPLIPGERELQLMPADLKGQYCLELGCGAGQNSICLARRGAHCLAVDLSAEQLHAGAALAREQRLDVTFVQANLEQLPFATACSFDLIHSAYALPFLTDQRACILRAAELLRPGGMLILSTAHPVSTGEWVSLDGDEGIFLLNYFSPVPDRRTQDDGAAAVCQPQPLSRVFAWLTEGGLQVDRFLEPRPLPAHEWSPNDRDKRVPYWSDAWVDCRSQLERVPFVAIFRACKPGTGKSCCDEKKAT